MPLPLPDGASEEMFQRGVVEFIREAVRHGMWRDERTGYVDRVDLFVFLRNHLNYSDGKLGELIDEGIESANLK